eukprot:g1366.t1
MGFFVQTGLTAVLAVRAVVVATTAIMPHAVMDSTAIHPVKHLTFEAARHELTLSQEQLRKVEALGMHEQRKLRARVVAIEKAFRDNRKRIMRVMRADAEINHVDVKTLNPNDYGLPKHAPVAQVRNELQLCKTFVSVAQRALQKLKGYKSGLWRRRLHRQRRLLEGGFLGLGHGWSVPAVRHAASKAGAKSKATPNGASPAIASMPFSSSMPRAAESTMGAHTGGFQGAVQGGIGIHSGASRPGPDAGAAPAVGKSKSPLEQALVDEQRSRAALQRAYRKRAVVAARLSFTAHNALSVLKSEDAIRAVQTAALTVTDSLTIKRMLFALDDVEKRLLRVSPLAVQLRAAYISRREQLRAMGKVLARRYSSDEAKALRAALQTPEFDILRREYGEEVHLQVKTLSLLHAHVAWDAGFGDASGQ